MTYPVYCPACGSDEITETEAGHFHCQHCGCQFPSNPSLPSHFSQELKKQTALLRKVTTLLEKYLRKGYTEDDKETILQQLEQRRGLATGEVKTLLNCSKDSALSMMKEIGHIQGYRYIQGSGNQPSRIVRLARNAANTTTG